MDPKRTCPECGVAFDAAEANLLACPLCGAAVPAPPPPAAAAVPPPAGSGGHLRTGLVAVAAVVFVIGGLLYAVPLLQQDTRKAPDQQATTFAARPAGPVVLTPTAPPVLIDPPTPPARPEPPPTRPTVPPAKPAPAPEPPSDAAPAPEPLAARVNRAIDRGVACLRRDWCPPNGHLAGGSRSLLGLTLLECGVDRDDPAVRQLADWVRHEQRLGHTYELSLAILFLDRLGDPADEATIQTFARRLLAGQSEAGTWSYDCQESHPQQNAQLVVPHDPLFVPHDQAFVPHDQLFVPHGQAVDPDVPAVVPPIAYSAPRPRKANIPGDHSNTQFALLGLWTARRHGVSVQGALDRTAQYFQEIQHGDGSWAYTAGIDRSRPSMTCVGLVSLAMAGRAKAGEGQYAPPVANALAFLGGVLDKTSPERGEEPRVDGGYPTYFLWSLERTSVIYDLRTVGDKEWYPWAAEYLVSAQEPDGSWQDGLGKPVATCLALLVLKRSNVTLDLLVHRPGTPDDLTGPDVMPHTGGPGMTIIQGSHVIHVPGDAPGAPNGYIAPLQKK